MGWGKGLWGILALGCMLAGCGDARYRHQGPRLDDPIENLPARVLMQGRWSEPPAYQVREVGASRMVSLHAKVQTHMEPEVPRLAYALLPEKRSGLRWVSPDPSGCEISQFDVRKSNADDMTLEFQIWGWDANDNKSCERLLDVARKSGLQVELQEVAVRNSPHLAALVLNLVP